MAALPQDGLAQIDGGLAVGQVNDVQANRRDGGVAAGRQVMAKAGEAVRVGESAAAPSPDDWLLWMCRTSPPCDAPHRCPSP